MRDSPKTLKARQLTTGDLRLIDRLVRIHKRKCHAAKAIGIDPSTLGRYMSGDCHPINAAALEGLRAAIARALQEVKP